MEDALGVANFGSNNLTCGMVLILVLMEDALGVLYSIND